MSRITAHLPDKDLILDSDSNHTIKDSLMTAGILLNAPCGGNGSCGKCTVSLKEGDEWKDVLACQIRPQEDIEIRIPASSLLQKEIYLEHQTGQIESHRKYAAAVDLGTTTVVVALIDLENGSLMDIRKEWNRQIHFGSDVISRVKYIIDHDQGLTELSLVIQAQVLEMIQEMCPDTDLLSKIHLAGNTIMQHIFAGIDPTSIAMAPYQPKTLFDDGKAYSFKELMNIPLYFMPCISGYVGGDILSGLYYTNLLEKDGSNLFLDIGTNGEMAIASNGQIKTVSVATGPAFEGAEITCGMTGIPGAISHIQWQETLCKMPLSVIGDTIPQGLCGSGLIDLIAILVETGYIDQTGHLLSKKEVKKEIPTLTNARFKNCLGYKFLQEDDEGNVIFYLRSQPPVYLTNKDVRKIQLAKASVAAGIEFLMKESSKKSNGISHLYLAGGFGEHIDPESAAKIGMIPDQVKDKVENLGNTSLKGVIKSLTDQDYLANMLSIKSKCDYTELSGNPAFSEDFVDHINFES